MKLATYEDGTRDGQLVVVSRNLELAAPVADIARSMLDALERWDDVVDRLQRRYDDLDARDVPGRTPFNVHRCAAPLPRSPQWCDASAFLNHAMLMSRVFRQPVPVDLERVPLMYQGASDDFLGPHSDVPFLSEADGIDVEGEFGVIVGNVPMGTSANSALRYAKLLVQLNDWSLRAVGAVEMRTGFGFLRAKPSTSFAPVAITPDELGKRWVDGRVHLDLHVEINGRELGRPYGGAMGFGFHELIAHAAGTRRLSAGTIIGSGTVSNARRDVGVACIAEQRAIEMLDSGEPRTPYLNFGDRVRLRASEGGSGEYPFGVIDQRVVAAAIEKEGMSCT